MPVTKLTPRQNEIANLVAQGLDNKTIARRMGISNKTVRNQLVSVFEKLDIENRVQLAVLITNKVRC